MAKWRRSTNTLEEFIHDTCELVSEHPYLRADFYKDYTQWCSDNGRKPFSKGRVKELLENNIGMNIRLVQVNGYETFRGIKQKPPQKSSVKTTKEAMPSPASSPLSTDDITEVPAIPEALF